jgi:hypothetical protein
MKKGMRSFGVLLMLCMLPFLWGCPYESKVPLSKSTTAEIDRELLGEWLSISEKGDKPFTMTIQQFNDHELLIFGAELKNGTCKAEAIRAFVTLIKDERFLSVQEIKREAEPRGWWIVKYTISGDTLTAWTVEDKLFTKPITSSGALYGFIKKNLHNKDLYGTDYPMVYQRVRQ